MPAYPRQDRPQSPASTSSAATSTPARPKHVYSTSPAPSTTSCSSTVTPGGPQQKLNVVTRVAIEGKTKKDKDGASVRMYLKMSIPLDQVQPGMTIPLFPEENVKILTSYVHPLNNHSVPYNFSSTLCPLLHRAARALNLPARSTETFNSANSIPVISPPSRSESRSVKSNKISVDGGSENIATVDIQYTGHILVSGYQISYVLPKVFPTRPKNLSETESEDYARRPRRLSVGDRGSAQFMAAIDMWIPFVSHPPRYPYLLSIPVARCLHNNIKLRIFPPAAPNASYASLSSIEEDGNSWDLTSDPHVTRAAKRSSRSNSYSHFADDESSDSSTTGFSDGCGIQGTFPSAERIRIRWAKPIKTIDVPGRTSDGRRRVGVREVKGEMTCIVRGKQRVKERNGADGVLLDVVYKGTCRGVWFPGVATLLGLDVGLETKGSDAYWVDGAPNTWDISGGGGDAYQGFDIGASPRQTGLQSRTVSLDSNNSNVSQLHIFSSPPDSASAQFIRTNSSSSNVSLLRAPLPAQVGGEYSFESSNAGLSSTSALSSMTSLTPASSSSTLAVPETTPGLPITLHVNIDELIAPANNAFTFTISGTILVVARPTLSSISNLANTGDEYDSPDPEPIVLPRFTVLAADSETTNTTVHNEVQDAHISVEVYNPTGDIYRDAQAKKTVLQKGGFTKCSDPGSRIALRSVGLSNGDLSGPRHPKQASGPRTPTVKAAALPRVSSNSPLPRTMYSRPKRTGPLSIPSVMASVTPLSRTGELLPKSYAVRVCLYAPSDTGSEWLEFGLAKHDSDPVPLSNTDNGGVPHQVVIVSATVEGIPVEHDTIATAKPEASGLGLSFDQMSGEEWISWVKVHVGSGGGTLVLDYIVSERVQDEVKGKLRTKETLSFRVFLPSFSIPVGRFEVSIENSGLGIVSLRSNFVHQLSTSTGSRLLNYSMDEFFYPNISMTVRPHKRTYTSWTTTNFLSLMTLALIIAGFIVMHHLNEQQIMRYQSGLHTPVVKSEWSVLLETATTTTTVTSTVYTSVTRTKWREGPTSGSLETSKPSLSYTSYSATPEPTASPTGLAPPEKSTDADNGIGNPHQPQERFALSLPIQHFLNITWPTHDFDATIERVLQTLDRVWHFLRKAYHYPLDPP
ncbi:hypothetical protein C0995_007197 [Termitomyces sp. Mi166|nr:hypothetical protein C0995_007197 [Termitomyces sp. Mi166\